MTKISTLKYKRVAKILLKNRKGIYWDWLSDLDGKRASKKQANKFLLACILDYQIPAETAWDNARWLAEDYFGNPSNLWEKIAKFSENQWKSKFHQLSLHRYPAAHHRVWRIGRQIVSEYSGDARKIWREQSVDTILDRLTELRVGPEISRMVVGALIDTGQITGSGEVKADLHVKRVLGRVFSGEMFDPTEVHWTTKQMVQRNRWRLDRPLYFVGKDYCYASNPGCPDCFLRAECKFYKSN